MIGQRPVSLYREAEQEILSLSDSFRFCCHDGLNCYNRCCRTPTILLSPYDILRLKEYLHITSGEFLRRYTLRLTEENSRLPLIFLDTSRSPEGGCPFVGAAGCRVYPRRPAACRLFPITMGSELTPTAVVDYYFCRRLDYCRGFDSETAWTVADWQASQGFPEYDRGRRDWLEILLRAGLEKPQPIDSRWQELLATVANDLDAFRSLISESGFRQVHELNDQALETLKRDDLALLRFSYSYLRALLFPSHPGTDLNGLFARILRSLRLPQKA